MTSNPFLSFNNARTVAFEHDLPFAKTNVCLKADRLLLIRHEGDVGKVVNLFHKPFFGAPQTIDKDQPNVLVGVSATHFDFKMFLERCECIWNAGFCFYRIHYLDRRVFDNLCTDTHRHNRILEHLAASFCLKVFD